MCYLLNLIIKTAMCYFLSLNKPLRARAIIYKIVDVDRDVLVILENRLLNFPKCCKPVVKHSHQLKVSYLNLQLNKLH